MGYPMSYRRVVNRNGLATGSYDAIPEGIRFVIFRPVSIKPWIEHDPKFLAEMVEMAIDRADRIESKLRMICGDLRRLEHDAIDEDAICQRIAERTGVDADTCAAVIAAFMEVP